MNFDFTEEQKLIRETAREYAEREVIKDVLERDAKAEIPWRHIKNLAELGFFGMTVDPKYGGVGVDTLSYALVIEEISKIDASLGVILSVHNSLPCHAIEKFGTEEQREKYLYDLATGTKLGAFLLSEPEAGSDATSQHTTAIDHGDYYLVNGVKNWITSANCGSIYIVFAQTHAERRHKGINAFIVEKEWPGISLGPHEDKMGLRSSDTHSVMFNDLQVPKINRIGEDGEGFKLAMKLLETGRISIAAQATGIAAGALERSVKYAKERKAFGRPIIEHEGVGFKLAEMAVKVEAARNLVYKAAWLKDNQQPYGLASSMAKLYASEIAMEVTTEAVQVHGGYGYVKEYHVERLMREAKVTQIYEGTSEIQKMVISRALIQE